MRGKLNSVYSLRLVLSTNSRNKGGIWGGHGSYEHILCNDPCKLLWQANAELLECLIEPENVLMEKLHSEHLWISSAHFIFMLATEDWAIVHNICDKHPEFAVAEIYLTLWHGHYKL